ERSHTETGTPNFVTAILADYRAYDTLGETTVIFTAGLACVLILRVQLQRPGRGRRP
ncbi:MAG: cation:proton antiporter, partial [Candidatus Tectomicrobia bacterium]|nr:cation:proton antiporter [Candidatus Tectomicrobia bacterium]